VSRFTAAAFAPTAFEFAAFGKPSQREPGEMRVIRCDLLRALGQPAPPALPALAGKIRESPAGGATPVPLPARQIRHKSGAGRSLVEPQAAHPFIHHLRVTQLG